MNLWRTLVLLILALAAGLYVFLVESKKPSPAEREQLEKEIFQIKPEQINFFQIRKETSSIALEKDGEFWNITEPQIKAQADPIVVNHLLESVLDATMQRSFTDPQINEKLAEYGLDHSLLTVALKTGEGITKELQFGKTNPTNDARYAKFTDSEQVLLLPAYLYEDLSTNTIFDLRDKSVIALEKNDVVRMQIQFIGKDVSHPEQTILLSSILDFKKGYEANWSLEQPLATDADDEKINRLLSDLVDLKAAEFIDQPAQLSDYGLDPPLIQLTFYSRADDSAKTLNFGKLKNDSQIYAYNPARQKVLLVSKNIYDQLQAPIEDLRERKFFKFDLFEVQKIKYQAEEIPQRTAALNLICEKKDYQEWQMQEPLQVSAEGELLESLLYDLEDLKAKSFIAENPTDLEPFGLTNPQITITLTQAKENQEPYNSTLLIGAATDAGYYAKNADQPAVYLIESTLVKKFPDTLTGWRDKKVLHFSSYNVNKVRIRLSQMTDQETPLLEILLEKKDFREWSGKINQSKVKVEVDQLEALLHELENIKIVEYVNDKPEDLSTYGLEPPAGEITLWFKNPTAEETKPMPNEKEGLIWSEIPGAQKEKEGEEEIELTHYVKKPDQNSIYRISYHYIKAIQEFCTSTASKR